MDKKILKKAGLSDQEVDIYLVLLRTGSVPVSTISKKTGLHRSNLYDTLEKLQTKGLVSYVVKNNVKYYQAAPPSRVVSYFEERLADVRNIVPDMVKLTKLPKEEAVVELFKAKEGLKTVFKDIVNEGKDYWVYGAAEKFEEILPIYSKQFFRQVDEKQMKERIVFEEGTKVEMKTMKGEYRFMPKDQLVPTSFNVYGDKVALFIWTFPMYAILIKNKEVADTYRKYFEFLWALARE